MVLKVVDFREDKEVRVFEWLLVLEVFRMKIGVGEVGIVLFIGLGVKVELFGFR